MNNQASGTAYIAAVATAPGPYAADQSFAEEFMRTHYASKLNARSMGLLRTIFSHPSIRKRHFAFDDPLCLVQENRDERIARFTRWSIELSARAVTQALADAGAGTAELSAVVLNTCTGYICPGISTYLIERLGLAQDIRVYDLVGSGCGGAVPNIEIAAALLRQHGGVVASLSVEICSATFQMDNDLSLILSNALFGDGAAAVILREEPGGYEIAASTSAYAPEHRETIRYIHKDGELHNKLSLKLPDLVNKAAAGAAGRLLRDHSLTPREVRNWALHTGGEKIINAVRDEIGLTEEQVAASRTVLAEYGNMSSPTVWYVLKELERRGISSGEWVMLLAYGAGLSAHALLLRKK